MTAALIWASPAAAEKRFFTVLAVEPKGGTTVDKEPFPAGALPPGGGYVIAQPDEKTRRWEVTNEQRAALKAISTGQRCAVAVLAEARVLPKEDIAPLRTTFPEITKRV